MIFVAVGTFINGFDELVEAADTAAKQLDTDGFAQIGHSKSIPETLIWSRFLDNKEMQLYMANASVIVCHAGLGIVSEAMRCRKPLVLMPRIGPTTRNNPANDQRAFARKIKKMYPLEICEDRRQMSECIENAFAAKRQSYPIMPESNIPRLISNFLSNTR